MIAKLCEFANWEAAQAAGVRSKPQAAEQRSVIALDSSAKRGAEGANYNQLRIGANCEIPAQPACNLSIRYGNTRTGTFGTFKKHLAVGPFHISWRRCYLLRGNRRMSEPRCVKSNRTGLEVTQRSPINAKLKVPSFQPRILITANSII